MPNEAESQEISSQQKIEKGSILNYFTKKGVTASKSKLKVADAALNRCNDSDVYKVEEKIVKSTERKNGKITGDIPGNVTKKQLGDGSQVTVNIKKTNKSLHLGVGCHGTGSAVTETLSDESEDFELKSSKRVDGSDEKLHASLDKSATKHKNIFVFMMANRDKQNEVLKKMAEEELMNNEESGNKSEKQSKLLHGSSQVSKKNDEVDLMALDLQSTKGSKKTQCMDTENSPLKKKKSPRKRSKSHKGSEVFSAKGSKTSRSVTGILDKDDDFVSTEQSQGKTEFVGGGKFRGKSKEDESGFISSEQSISKYSRNEDLDSIEPSNRIKNRSCLDSGTRKDFIEVDRPASDVSTDEDCIELVAPQTSQNRAAASVAKVQTTPPAVIGNAFTLLMTNRHKMNKKTVEKKDELVDEDTCTVELKHLKIQKRKAGKYDEYPPGKRGRKRKKSFSCDLDSSLNDFEGTPKKKKRSKRRRRIIESEDSSTEDEDQISQGGILSEGHSVTDISCGEIEVSSKKVVEDQTPVMSVSYVQDISKCKEPKNLSDHRPDKSKSSILNAKNCLVGKGKEIEVKGECSSCSVMDEGGKRDYTSSDEGVSSGTPVEVSGNRRKKNSMKVGSFSKSDMSDSGALNKMKDETECSDASTSEINNEEEKLNDKVVTSPHKTVESISSGEKSLTLMLRRVRNLSTSDTKYTATLEEGKADKSVGEKAFLCEKTQDRVNEPPIEEDFSVALTSPPKKRRKKGKSMELDDEDNNSRNNCNDKYPVKTERKGEGDDYGADCSKDEKSNGDSLPISKKGNIATFFKKMSKEEKAVERSKSVITIKADVHAPCEGYSPNKKSRTSLRAGTCGGIPQNKEKTQVRRSSRRLKKELEDFNKIELLEQIQVNSPKKIPGIENVRKDMKGKGMKKASLNAEICTIKDNKPSQAHVSDSAPENIKEMHIIDTLKRENTNDGSVSKPSKTCKKSKESPQDTSECSTKRDKKKEVDDIWQDITVGKISVKGITTVKGKSKKLSKKKQGGKNGQPKLMVNKIKEVRSERKVDSNKPGRKKKKSQKKQVLNDLSKDKDGKVSGKSDKLDEYCDLGNELENVGKSKAPLNKNNSAEIVAGETSPFSDVIHDKEMKRKLFPKRVTEAAEDANDDKENMEQTSQQAAKKSRNVESMSLLKEGSIFQSFDEWSIYLEKLKDDGHSSIRIRNSRSIDAFAKLSSRMIKPSLKYAYVVYECGFISSEKPKKLIKESQQNSTIRCPWKLKIMPSTDGESLVIKEICLDHNHLLGKKNKEGYALETHTDSSDDNELVHVDTTDLSTSKSKRSQRKASIGSKKKSQLVVCKVVTDRKMLSSQENLKNQIQGQTKASKAVGKRKRSPKRRNKRLIAEITALQDDVIKEMAKTNINVSIAVSDEDVNIVSEDSSCDKATKTSSKKSKIFPLVLKPPPKEVKPVKVKDGKKCMKKSLETKRQKEKTDKNPNLNEDSKSVTSRPSRQAAIKVKRMFQDMSSSEDSDISEIEAVSRGSLKVTCSKTCKTKDVKLGKTKQDDSTRKEEKLAPIFCRRPKSPEIEVLKIALSPSKLKARQDFLQSGVPEQIKKQQLLEKSQEEQLIISAPFPEFNHIQQRDGSDLFWNLQSPKTLSLKEEAENYVPKYTCTSIYQENIFNKAQPLESNLLLTESCSLDVTSVVVILNALKKNNPRFPVFSSFDVYLNQKKEAVELYKRELVREDKISLIDLEEEETKSDKRKRRSKEGLSRRGRKKKGSGKKIRMSEEMQEIEETPPLPVWHERIPNIWTQVYAPKKGSQVIGNKCHVKKLRRWLQDWKSKSEAFAVKERNKKARLSRKGDSDFIVSEESSCDEEDFVSTYLLCGPPGVGKTAVVYALAAELGYNVLEVNASSKRPGKHVMSQLAEATQSHSVSSSSNQPANAIAAMFAAKSGSSSKKVKNKAFASKEEVSQGCNRDVEKKKGLSVVLFEDIDIVFEESDEGFLSTVNNFMIATKRPIILTISYPSHSALSKIKSSYERLDFEPPPEDLIAQHLQLICLVNGQHICLGDIENLVSVNKCDIRQSLLDVQAWSNFGSSSEKCSCLTNTGSKEDVILEAVSLSDIFSEKIDTKSKIVETYRKKLWGKVHSRYIADLEKHKQTDISVNLRIMTKDSQSVTWTQTAKSLPFFLPYTLNEKKITKKYPLQADDPSLRTTYLWQKYNWLSIDEDEDESSPPPVVETEGDKEPEENIQAPQYVIDSSEKCVASIARFYNTVSELDVLDSHYRLAQPGKDNSYGDWWKRHPTPGLSDLERHYKHWGLCTLTPHIVEEIGHRAFQQCYYESKKYLEDMPTTDWSQVSLPVQENEKPALLESQLNAYERSLKEYEKIDERLLNQVPLVHQLNRKGFMDYLCFMRSVVRHDELTAVLCKSRRGRRYLSQASHYGIDLSGGDKIKLANSLCP